MLASLLAAMLCGLITDRASAAERVVIKPDGGADGALVFDLAGVAADRTFAARVTMRGKRRLIRRKVHRHDSSRARRRARRAIRKRLRKEIGAARVRTLASSAGPLRIRRPRVARRGRLQLRLADPGPEGGCAVEPQTLTAAGCELVQADTSAARNSLPLWRRLDCVSESRYEFRTTGGDPAPTALGQSQGNSAYRQLTVMDGDDFFGERCELGRNNLSGSFQLYREGQRRITFVSFRLPGDFPLEVDSWHQAVLQMKQTQPTNNGGGTPVLALHAIGGRWRLNRSDSPGPSSRASTLWTTPARKGVWTRMAFDVTYSQDSGIGGVKTYIDANGDGDATDAGEQSPTIATYTLKREARGGKSPIRRGASIPSHLRVGPYRNPDLDCPAAGCSVQVDNVEVVRR